MLRVSWREAEPAGTLGQSRGAPMPVDAPPSAKSENPAPAGHLISTDGVTADG